MKKLALAALCAVFVTSQACANVFITVKNESTEDCSVAFHARIDKTKWLTVGWYVFASGEEAPVILDKVNDIHDVFVYHDCPRSIKPEDETKKAWVLENRKFIDEVSREKESGYVEKIFVRLAGDKFIISGPSS
ncbi:Uncharacterised protein [Anaerobiospirillum thomasii]|uniref:Uncharacterized protein n=1 Tax=Anaerobiospirillum thomasii TaxID=179995 RepID=A0A2X0VLL3_9GAMM|nr:hypothetical protein [Anaerobiospirillum thomasii]SPT67902.1 Uncharacterised protein [Anaerobiospirillum thomasii]SPT70358.1 Uncharacterised protein [Anaerobiospirillum thomasii]